MNNNILIPDRHASMMQKVIALLYENGFVNTKGVLTNHEVHHELLTNNYGIFIIGGGVDDETRIMIRRLITDNNIQIKLVEHFGNAEKLIEEISEH
ncbi:MAG TPA: hypothetical protein PL045_09415 [Chitinophagaceae bacterium]|nr:hypothetical protein [Chitinophagaceae bacterium]